MHVHFEGLDESDGAWVDDTDEWKWVPSPPGGIPPAIPVHGAWRPGLYAGPVEKIFLARTGEEGATEVLVKWKGLSHVHCQWVPQVELEVEPNNKRSVHRFLKAMSAEFGGGGPSGEGATWELELDPDTHASRTEEEPYNPDFEVVERVICVVVPKGEEDLPPRYLVKWRSLPYANCTCVGRPVPPLERVACPTAPAAAPPAPPPSSAASARTRATALKSATRCLKSATRCLKPATRWPQICHPLASRVAVRASRPLRTCYGSLRTCLGSVCARLGSVRTRLGSVRARLGSVRACLG